MTLFSEDYEVHLTKKEASEIDIAEIAKNCEIEISDVNSEGHFLIEFEGRFGFVDDELCAFVQLDWYRKYWDYPIGLMYHMCKLPLIRTA
tara:strand:+ start:295 stop:564 length:270 start_codon:yes stop_codon:yes gene_type:complete